MGELTCGIYFQPSFKTSVKDIDDVNARDFICSDHKVHIRLHDYDTEQAIIGFEHKLTYLLSYLLNYEYLPSLIGEYNSKTILSDFIKSDDVIEILQCIKSQILEPNYRFKGIKIKLVYSKVRESQLFGLFDQGSFPVNSEDGIIKIGSLKQFLQSFNIDLKDYLFNDKYMIIIQKDYGIEANQKFINKQIRKAMKEQNNINSQFNVTELW